MREGLALRPARLVIEPGDVIVLEVSAADRPKTMVLACEGTGVLPCVPKTLTSGHAKRGLFNGQDFVYDAESVWTDFR